MALTLRGHGTWVAAAGGVGSGAAPLSGCGGERRAPHLLHFRSVGLVCGVMQFWHVHWFLWSCAPQNCWKSSG